MSIYVNIKAIKLIALFVGFAPLYEAPGILPSLKIQAAEHPSLSGAKDRT